MYICIVVGVMPSSELRPHVLLGLRGFRFSFMSRIKLSCDSQKARAREVLLFSVFKDHDEVSIPIIFGQCLSYCRCVSRFASVSKVGINPYVSHAVMRFLSARMNQTRLPMRLCPNIAMVN